MMRYKFKTIKNNQGKIFLRRLSVYFKRGSLKIHLITGDDSDVYHTHPWNFVSFILFGGYREFSKGINDDGIHWTSIMEYRAPSINKKFYFQQHRTELFKLFGYKIPTLTIGWYSEKKELCSFCKEEGYCLSNT